MNNAVRNQIDLLAGWLPNENSLLINDIILDPLSPVLNKPENSARVLVVDDDVDMLQYLVYLLKIQYHVDTALDGESALLLIKTHLPDLIIIDVMMPRMNGFELLKELRASPRTVNIPMIMLSARASVDYKVEGLESGADDYLVKPLSAQVLLASVSSHLKMARIRRETNEVIQKSEARFRALISAISDLVYRMSPDWNEMQYLQGDEFVEDTFEPHRTWFDKYIYPHDRDLVKKEIQRAIQAKGVYELEHRIHDIDGATHWIHSRAIPILDKDNEIVEWFGIASYVTRRKEAEQALHEASRYKDEFLATLAHELRNPLAPLSNGLQMLQFSEGNSELPKQVLEIMSRQLAQIVRLVDDLLDLSRICCGKIKLQKEDVELSTIIQRALEINQPTSDKAGHRVEIDMPSLSIYLHADVTRLIQVFANLLNNASKYTKKGGWIRLSIYLEEEYVRVSVRDNGVGIPALMLPHVFEMFSQVDQHLDRSQGGLGIGLSIVKKLVELHSGTVEVKSDGQDLGSEFIVRLPRVLSHVKAKSSEEKPLPSISGRRILVVDDNYDVAKSLAMLLELMGNTIKTASDGLEAIEIAGTFLPDIVLMDIGMPRMNGYETAKEIRKNSWGRKLTLIALTGWGLEEDRSRSQESGFNFHITKPVNLVALEQLLVATEFE